MSRIAKAKKEPSREAKIIMEEIDYLAGILHQQEAESISFEAIPVQWLEEKALTLDLASMESIFKLLSEWKELNT